MPAGSAGPVPGAGHRAQGGVRECQERVPGAARSPRDGRLATAAAGRLWIGSTAGGCATGATARAGYCQRVVLLGAERTQQDAAARNQRDLGRLRAAFPGYCCHNLLFRHVLGRGVGCTAELQQNEENEVGCYSGGKFRDHDVPDDFEDLELKSWP